MSNYGRNGKVKIAHMGYHFLNQGENANLFSKYDGFNREIFCSTPKGFQKKKKMNREGKTWDFPTACVLTLPHLY